MSQTGGTHEGGTTVKANGGRHTRASCLFFFATLHIVVCAHGRAGGRGGGDPAVPGTISSKGPPGARRATTPIIVKHIAVKSIQIGLLLWRKSPLLL